jgi:aryl-alcohol dehydrogenase-like predicted oxidoreductase
MGFLQGQKLLLGSPVLRALFPYWKIILVYGFQSQRKNMVQSVEASLKRLQTALRSMQRRAFVQHWPTLPPRISNSQERKRL